MLKRSYFFYLLVIVLLLMVNSDVIHQQRGGYLWYLYEQVGKKKNIPAANQYFDYLRRLDPQDITIWIDWINVHLSVNDSVGARDVALLAVRLTPKNSRNYSVLVSLLNNLNDVASIK